MIRRSVVVLAKAGRTIVRDPRKRAAAVPSIRSAEAHEPHAVSSAPPTPPTRDPLPFEPSVENQQSVGSTLGSYVLTGAGMAVGFSIVGAIFGGF